MATTIRMRWREVAETLQCSRDHLYSLNRQKRLRKYSDGPRFTFWLRDEVEAYARGIDPYAEQEDAQAHNELAGQGVEA